MQTLCIALCSRIVSWHSCRRPALRRIALAPILERVTLLEQRLPIQLDPGPDVNLSADPDQLEQMLINLLANAVEASLEQWQRAGTRKLDVSGRERPDCD